MKYTLIEHTAVQAQLACPICGQVVVAQHLIQESNICSHTLFIAMDLGFEFAADRFESSLGCSIDDVHAAEQPNIWDCILQSNLAAVHMIKTPLGVANLYHYLGFLE